MWVMFQSTPPHGGRLHPPPDKVPEWWVSIHAPARGATSNSENSCSRARFQSTPPHGGRRDLDLRLAGISRFNPRPRTGGDSCSLSPISPSCKFQSTPPHGGRPRRPRRPPGPFPFQSTPPHGGRRGIKLCDATFVGVSIHAPARGATRRPRGLEDRPVVSIHAPARGATR